MIWRRVPAIVLVILAIVFAVVVAGRVRVRLQNNHATYLMNQQKYEEAAKVLSALTQRGEANAHTSLLRAKVAMLQGDFTQPGEILSRIPNSGLVLHLRALCEYQSGRDQDAARLFAQAAASDDDSMPSPGRDLARQFSAALITTGTRVTTDRPPNRLDAGVWVALRARRAFFSGEFQQARTGFLQAMMLGDRNPNTLQFAAASCAATGDMANALRIADRSDESFLSRVESTLETAVDLVTTFSISAQESARTANKIRDLKRASAWAALQRGVATGERGHMERAMKNLDHPSSCSDPARELLRGDILEALGLLPDAYALYRNLLASQPSYECWLRAAQLVGDDPQLLAMESGFLTGPNVVAFIPALAMETSQTEPRRDYLAFFKQASAATTVSVPETGEYALDFIARGDRAFGLSPEVTVSVDDSHMETLYITRESWAPCRVPVIMQKGEHRVRLEYTNNSERLFSLEEDRNFYLRGTIVSRTGGVE